MIDELSTFLTLGFQPSTLQERKIDITTVIVPKITCSIWFEVEALDYNSLSPILRKPWRIDILLRVDTFAEVIQLDLLSRSQQNLEGHSVTKLNQGLPRSVWPHTSHLCRIQGWYYADCADSGRLKKPQQVRLPSLEEQSMLNQFRINHSYNKGGRFVVRLPKRPNTKLIRTSHS